MVQVTEERYAQLLAAEVERDRLAAALGSEHKGRSAVGEGPVPSPAEDAAAFEVSDGMAAGAERRAEVA